MSNQFSKEEKVMFDQSLEAFQDGLAMSTNVTIKNVNPTDMERGGDVMRYPMPYIVSSFDGADQTTNFKSQTQLTVPITIGYDKSVPWSMSATELRDALQNENLGKSARQKLASDINTAVLNVAAAQGTLFVKRSAAAVGFDDVAQCDAIFNEQGIAGEDRKLFLTSRDYNGMANNLQVASRSFGNKISDEALRRGQVGMISSFETYKLDVGKRLTAAAGGGSLTIDTRAAALNYYVPAATSTATTTGEKSNVDNRYQTITISSTTSVVAGDAFTIAGSEACHHITKGSTGQLKTHRVISVPSSTTLVISPPIISNQGATNAEAQYQNVVLTESSAAAIVFLNTVTANVNPFWHKDSMLLIPGKLAVPSDAGASVMRGSTDQGVELVMIKQFDIETRLTRFRFDTSFGVACVQPEMAGIMMFSQT